MNLKSYEWVIVGAGPAGMAALGKLLDNGVPAQSIAWIDPEFKVGDLGTRWPNVSSNTKVKLFTKFLQACQSFHYANCKEKFDLADLDPEKTCLLKHTVAPLQWVTEQLKSQVVPIQAKVESLKVINRHWQIEMANDIIMAKNVVLAIGAEPKYLPNLPTPIIPMVDAMDKERLAKWVDSNDTVAVFGASHSAIIVIRSLVELGVKQVINFYRGALRYAVYLDDWILFDNTGLKGETAVWAREHIDGQLPANVLRVWSKEENIQHYLPQCSKAIHAVGFQRRDIPITGLETVEYNVKSGIIAPGLFGCGIAFPEETIDRFGNVELNVGLWKFMVYLDRVVPVWLKYNL